MTNYVYSFRDARGITFEDGLNPNSTIRFGRTIAPKTVDGLKLTNVRSDTVIVRQVDPRGADCKDCAAVLEPLSARLILTGSRNNKAALVAMLNTLVKAVVDNHDALLNGSLPAPDAVIVIDPAV